MSGENLRGTWSRGWRWLRGPEGRQLLAWCLPALVIGFALRAWLTWDMPFGYYQFDTPDYLVTPHRLLMHGSLTIHGKKTFLVPVLYTLACLFPAPALVTIPLAQHALGLALVVIMGALTRLWFRFWKVAIVPITVLTAINPAMLWFEHSLLAEAVWLFLLGALFLVGTLFFQQRTPGLYWLLWIVTVLVGGTRPEGHYLAAFGLLLVGCVYFGQWRELGKRLGMALLLTIALDLATPTEEGGSLLYASVVHLTPDRITAAPGIEPVLLPMRDAYRARWQVVPEDVKRVQKDLNAVLHEYIKTHGLKDQTDEHKLAKRIAMQACLSHPGALPKIAINKFLLGMYVPSTGSFDERWVYDKQQRAFERNDDTMVKLAKRLTGRAMSDPAELVTFMRAHYRPVGWFNWLEEKWFTAILKFGFPPTDYAQRSLPGLSYFFAVAACGLLATVVLPGRLWRLHVAMLGVWIGLFAVSFLVGPLNQRYRFIFEPFAVVYALILFDAVIGLALQLFRKLFRKNEGATAPV